MGEFLRKHDNREHWDRGEDVPMEVDDDPTGWGALPWAPTDTDRASNKYWDDFYGEWRTERWEEVEYEDDYGKQKVKEQLRDPDEREWYEKRQQMIDEYDTAAEWQNTRLPKRKYDERKNQIEEHGIGNVKLTPQTNGNFYYLKADFPSDFVHLTNQATQQKKVLTPEGYHISLSFRRELEQNEDHRAKMDAFLKEHFGMNNGVANFNSHPGKQFNLPRITVSGTGGVYQLAGESKFEKDLYELTQIGTGKDGLPHISLT
jgi:hypothetical protein